MEKFEVYCKDVCIGLLSVKEGKHMYEPNENANLMEQKLPIDPILLSKRDWGDEIPFFKSRLKEAKRFPDVSIGFQTDFYTLKKVD